MSVNVSIKGAGLAAEGALLELGSTSTARRVGQRTLMVAGEPMRALIAQLAPDDPATSPSLRDTVAMKPSNRDRNRDTATVLIGIDPDVQPAVVVQRKRGKGTYRDPRAAGVSVIKEFGDDREPASPFFRPGFEGQAAATIVRVGQLIGPEIEKSAARLARRRAKAR